MIIRDFVAVAVVKIILSVKGRNTLVFFYFKIPLQRMRLAVDKFLYVKSIIIYLKKQNRLKLILEVDYIYILILLYVIL